jgi:simple sugar transport system substrate-binding protein
MEAVGGRSRVLAVTDDDPSTPQRIADAVTSDRADGVLATNSLGGLAAADALAGQGVKIGTFDLGPDVLKAVQAGRIGFAVDQQPYLQGYLAVDALWLYRTNGNTSGGGVSPVLTGPAFVTKANVASVARYAARGTR